MKDKILFFIDGWFFHYGIARKIQEKFDCEMFAVIDVEDKTKTFFQNQKLVDFKKTWYYLDNVSTNQETYDIKYLQEFESKYNIDLWKIAYADRDFRNLNKFYKFSDDEILSILEQECKFFSKILDEIKPDFLATFVPASHHNLLLHQMCLNSNITPLTLATVKLWKRMMITKTPLVFDSHDLISSNFDTKNEEIKKYLEQYDPFKQISIKKKTNFEDKKIQRYNSILKFFTTSRTEGYGKKYSNFGRTKSAVFQRKLHNLFEKKKRRSFIDKFLITKPNFETPFIYYPLHYEPERILLVDSPYFDDQVTVISNIAKSLPVRYKLYVKEHPYMETIGWRDTSFYKKIMDLNNVILLHPSISQKEILSKCSLVVTIAGTACIEAAFYQKPSVVFTNQLYSVLPSVLTIKSMQDLSDAIKCSLEKKVDLSSVKNFINLLEKNSFEFNFLELGAEFAYKFGFKGPVMDSSLNEDEIKLFFDKHDSSFEMLADEHIKKINFHKNTTDQF